MVDAPVARPVTIPVLKVTVAFAVLLLLQVPPLIPSDKAVVLPLQTPRLPVIAVGDVLTESVLVAVQPPESL